MSELDALKKSHQVLRSKHEQAETKLAEFRDKLKETRQELSSKDRQLEVAKRMLQRISNEKSKAEAASEQGKAQVKKLEAKLTYSSSDIPPETSAKVSRLQTKLAEQTEQMQQMEARAMLAEETSLQLSQEVHVLKRALGIKKSLTNEVMDSQSKLLHQLAKSQEESTALALQLSQAEKTMQELQDRLEVSTTKIQQLQRAQAEGDARMADAQQQLSEALQSASVFRQDAETTRSQLARVQSALDTESVARARAEQQAASHLGKVQQLTERIQSIERASRLSIEALRSEVTLAVERSDSRAAEQRANAAVKEAQVSDRCVRLQQELEDSRALLQQERDRHATDGARLKQQLEVMQDEAERLRRVERQHIMEIGRLQGQIDTAAEVNKALQARLELLEDKAAATSSQAHSMVADLEHERQQTSRLRAEMDMMRSQLHTLADGRHSHEQQLQTQVGVLQRELAASNATASKLQEDLSRVREQLSVSSSRSGQADHYVQELQNTIATLTDSKNKLQSYMLDQLSVFKSKLQRAESDNQQLRAALAAGNAKQLRISSREQDLTDAEDQSPVSMAAGLAYA